MILEKLPNCMQNGYDEDSLVYQSDDTFFYNCKVPKDLVDDISNKEFQVYTGYYEPHIPKWEAWKAKKPESKPTIYLIGRGERSGKVKIKIEGFLPYCYMLDTSGEYETYLGDKVKKLIFECNPAAVGEFRKSLEKKGAAQPLEADIPFVRRFLCDTYPYFQPKDYIKPNVAIFDVETNFPISDEMISFSINSNGKIYHNNIHKTKDRKELILDLYNRLIEHDVVTGWNVSFDVGVLEKEMKDHVKYIRLNEDVAIIDLQTITKKMWARQIKGSWSLENAGDQIAKINKIPIKSYPRELTPDKLEEYNNQDVVVPAKIDEILGGIECHIALSWMAHCKLEDTEITTVVNDISILRAYHKANKILPSKPPWSQKPDKDKSEYEAADPQARPGVYSNIVSLDIKHAYPWAVQAINATPETKDKNGKYLAPNGIRFNDGESVFVNTLDDLMNERSKAKKNKKKYKEEQNDELFKKWKYIDFALKTQAAAFSHGEFGYWRSRMKDYKVAEAITSTTKKFIFFMMDKLEELGFEWVYSHTDSIYIKCKKKDIDELLSSVDLIVKSYCKEHGYRKEAILEFEQFYQRAYIHSPARNVLIAKTKDIDEPDKWVDPPNKVTGMNFFRSETPEALRRIEIDLVKLKLKRKSVISLIRYLKQAISNLGDLDSRELGIIKPLNKPINEYGGETEDGRKIPIPYHIQAYLDANEEYGFELEEGEKFMVLPILTDETTGTRKIKRVRNYIAFPISKGLPKQYDIDYEYYLKSNLYGKVYKLFDIPEDILEECVRDYIPNIKKANGIVEKAMEEKDDS